MVEVFLCISKNYILTIIIIKFKVKNRIYGKKRGWCFTPKHFSDLGNSGSIRKALSTLEKQEFIRGLAFGLYDYPRHHKVLGELPPKIENVIKAITEKEKVKYQPTGAYASNMLGLSDQVPAKVTVLTEGASKKIQIGKTEVIFKKTTPKNMASAGTITGLIIQALKYLGKDKVTDGIKKKLKTVISNEDKQRLQIDMDKGLAPVWITKIIENHQGLYAVSGRQLLAVIDFAESVYFANLNL